MRYLPIFMRVKHRRCLVVGGGSAAAAKASLLLRAGARVTVVAPTLDAHLADLARRGEVRAVRRSFEAADVEGNAVVIGATGLQGVDDAISAAAQAAGIFVDVVDQPALDAQPPFPTSRRRHAARQSTASRRAAITTADSARESRAPAPRSETDESAEGVCAAYWAY